MVATLDRDKNEYVIHSTIYALLGEPELVDAEDGTSLAFSGCTLTGQNQQIYAKICDLPQTPISAPIATSRGIEAAPGRAVPFSQRATVARVMPRRFANSSWVRSP